MVYNRKSSNRRRYNRKPKSSYRRRRSRRGWSKRNTTVSANQPFSNRYVTKLRYVSTISINSDNGLAVQHTFRANDLYDPDYTGIGHQPRGFDELMGIYENFTVIGSKITIQPQTLAEIPYIAGIRVNPDTSSQSSLSANMEQARTLWTLVTEGTTPRPLTFKFSPKSFFGVKNILDEADYSGTSSASPSKQAYFNIFVGPQNELSEMGSVSLNVIVEYLAVFTKRRNLGSS